MNDTASMNIAKELSGEGDGNALQMACHQGMLFT